MSATSRHEFTKFLVEISYKWQRKWYEEKIFEASPDVEKKKFFITAAFPYPNSPLHLGHGRTYTIADVYARFMRMKGFNVLFPMGFHYTGTPIIAMSDQVKKGDEELIDLFVNLYHIPEGDLEKLKTPLGMARYFHENMKRGMIRAGFSIDWRREFTSIDPLFSKFVQWQFEVLRKKGYITIGTHPVGWCPVDNNPVGMHDTKGDVEPEIGEFTLILFEGEDGFKYPCATLRPETIFGVTNIWIKPEAEYVKAGIGDLKCILSPKAAWKLGFQGMNVEIIGKVLGRDLIGVKVRNPMSGEVIPVLPAEFVDPNSGSGVVMSVPGHAPYDYVALRELISENKELLAKIGVDCESLKPISIISVKGFSNIPAEDVVLKYGVTSQVDKKLDDATRELYLLEYSKGVMKENCGRYSGLPVREARELVKSDLLSTGKALIMYEITNGPVYCRCGAEIVVKILENQWFLNYGDETWKSAVREYIKTLKIIPGELKREFQQVVEWLSRRACARQRGLGTPLPWTKGWIIESLSDSTIYMAFYTINYLLKAFNVKPEQLSKEVFDYIFLGIGKAEEISRNTGIPVEALRIFRREFEYWYPVDSRHSGKDLIPNHLTFYVFNHVAVFPREYWPKQIVVNGFVLYEGKKMSKSLRNVVPLLEVIEEYSPDIVRLSLLSSAEIGQDADFSSSIVMGITEKLRKIHGFLTSIVLEGESGHASREPDFMDEWLLSVLQSRVKSVTESMENLRIRDALNIVLYIIPQDLEWYLSRVEGCVNRRVVREFFETWVKLIAPFAPHYAEEVWSMMGYKTFVSLEKWPEPREELVRLDVEATEEYYRRILSDIKEILQVTGRAPKKIVFYLAPEWKVRAFKKVAEVIVNGGGPSDALRAVMSIPDIRKYGEEAVNATKRMSSIIMSLPEHIREYLAENAIDEEEMLMRNIDAIKKYYNVSEILVFRAEKAEYDPMNKAKQALPFKPAIFVE